MAGESLNKPSAWAGMSKYRQMRRTLCEETDTVLLHVETVRRGRLVCRNHLC